jgi:hypothetical protein
MEEKNEEFDWIFDYVLQFLESDKFDAAIMDFVDEKCFVFDDDEENKFEYTIIHDEFKEHIEALISSNLGELGITPELFVEACERARYGRDVNTAVFDRITAMDDFMTFKKIMVKRNTELQLEALQQFTWETEYPGIPGEDDEYENANADSRPGVRTNLESEMEMKTAIEASLRDQEMQGNTVDMPVPDLVEHKDAKEEKMYDASDAKGLDAEARDHDHDHDMDEADLTELLEGDLTDFAEKNLDDLDDKNMQEILRQSLLEMELMHRREEMEQDDLARAVAESIALEESRIKQLQIDEMKAAERQSKSLTESPDKGGPLASPVPHASAQTSSAKEDSTYVSDTRWG